MKIKVKILNCILVLLVQCCSGGEPNGQIEDIIEKLNQTAKSLKKFSAKIEYIHAQPLFDTQSLRRGKIFYIKDSNSSALRINFLTIKQDDSQEQDFREDYIFDGWKMTKIDYQSKSATAEQLAKEKPIEPFELVQDYFPIIGFAKPDELAKEFYIQLKKTNERNFISLLLAPKENSRFSKTYKQVEIKIDSKRFLPLNFSAITNEDEKIIIELSKIDTSTAINKNIFDVIIPADFVQTENKNN